MKVKKADDSKKKKPKSKLSGFMIFLLGVVVILVIAFFFWHQGMFSDISQQQKTTEEPLAVPEPPVPQKNGATTGPGDQQTASGGSLPQFNKQSSSVTELETTASTQEIEGTESAMGITTPGASQDISKFTDETSESNIDEITPFDEICDSTTSTIRRFYIHLDAQAYMKAYNLQKSSEEHFTQLIQKLLDNPPIVVGEMNDLFTILQNTAHFFRIIGKDNILILKGILDREKDDFENVLADFYTLLHTPLCPEKSFSLNVKQNSLYEYAGFFLNTMGGRLYLFRRDSMSRMVVSYYAILLVDKANKNAGNYHGIEIRASIDQLIEEMESTANSLLLLDQYLDKLYDLKEEYQ